MMRKFAALVPALMLLTAGRCRLRRRRRRRPPQTPDAVPRPALDVAVVRATVGTIESALEISGTLAPRTRVGVKPKLPGRSTRVLVDIGDRVRRPGGRDDRPRRDRRAGGRRRRRGRRRARRRSRAPRRRSRTR